MVSFSFFSLFYVFLGTLDDGQQLGLCVFDGFFFELLYAGLFVFLELFPLQSFIYFLLLLYLVLIFFLFFFESLNFFLNLLGQFLVEFELFFLLLDESTFLLYLLM